MTDIERIIELLKDDLDFSRKSIVEDIKCIKYSLDLLISDLETGKTYRCNVPDQAVNQLALKYTGYANTKSVIGMMESFKKNKQCKTEMENKK